MSQRAIVTGGTRGIGFAIARAILLDGGQVMISGRDAGQVSRAVDGLRRDARGESHVVGMAADVRDRSAVDALVAGAVRHFGQIDTLVNNAGVGAFTPVASMTDDEWATVIDTNLTGVFYCTRAALPEIRRAGGGWIVNIASLAGRNYFANGSAYCASKAGLIAFGESLMQEVRHDNIRVTVIMPGSVATEFSHPRAGDDSWKLSADDVAEAVMGLFRHPSRSLPSRIEIRPSQPK